MRALLTMKQNKMIPKKQAGKIHSKSPAVRNNRELLAISTHVGSLMMEGLESQAAWLSGNPLGPVEP